ncbi:MAG: galactose mutarotase [Clostridia bacterium]|nr:galactose mutarotase [Clostridia bacterium]
MEKVLFGKLSNGKEVNSYVIKSGNTEVTLLDYGATVQSLKYKGVDVVLGYDNIEQYEKGKDCFGGVVGRVANRIKGGKFTLGDKTYNLTKNDGGNTLHGGTFGFHTQIWGVEEHTESSITFKRLSPHNEEGFPGNLMVGVKYYICGEGLGIEYTAVSDRDTVVSLSNHTYFNLLGDETALNTFLSIDADAYTPIDKNFIPTGEIKPVKGTPMDFKWAKFVGRDIEEEDEQLALAGGYDHNFVLNGEGFRQFAVLSCARRNILVRCFTDQSGVQLYSGNFLRGELGKGGVAYEKGFGVCLETQSFPNAVNEEKFPTPILKKDEVYKSVTEYRFEDFMAK